MIVLLPGPLPPTLHEGLNLPVVLMLLKKKFHSNIAKNNQLCSVII